MDSNFWYCGHKSRGVPQHSEPVQVAFFIPDRIRYLPDRLLSRHRRPPCWVGDLEIVQPVLLWACELLKSVNFTDFARAAARGSAAAQIEPELAQRVGRLPASPRRAVAKTGRIRPFKRS